MREENESHPVASTRLVAYLRQRLLGAGLDTHADALRFRPGVVGPIAAVPDEPRMAVTQHLGAALADATPDVPEDVRLAIGQLALRAPWRQTASYVQRPPSTDFLDNYAHATLLGPYDGEQTSRAPDQLEVSIGLVLLGPGVIYPPHQHPADEVYVPLHRIDWTHERQGTPTPVAAGEVIHHLPWQPHSMTVGAHPALLLYLWSGDVTTPSRFCT